MDEPQELTEELKTIVTRKIDRNRLSCIMLRRDRLFVEIEKGEVVDGKFICHSLDNDTTEDREAVLEGDGNVTEPACDDFTKVLAWPETRAFVARVREAEKALPHRFHFA